jgi:hypothetical protein
MDPHRASADITSVSPAPRSIEDLVTPALIQGHSWCAKNEVVYVAGVAWTEGVRISTNEMILASTQRVSATTVHPAPTSTIPVQQTGSSVLVESLSPDAVIGFSDAIMSDSKVIPSWTSGAVRLSRRPFLLLIAGYSWHVLSSFALPRTSPQVNARRGIVYRPYI